MNINAFLHICGMLSPVVALIGFLGFLWNIFKQVKIIVVAACLILAQHREVYAWYLMHKTAKLEMGKEGIL